MKFPDMPLHNYLTDNVLSLALPGKTRPRAGVLVQRKLDKSVLRARERLAFGKEVFSGMAKR